MSAQAKQSCAAIFRWAQVGKPVRATKEDVGNTGQRLGVIDDGGSAPESDDSREGRPDSRDAALAFQRFHQCGFFTDLIRARATVPVNVEIVAAAEDILAQETAGVGVGNRLLHDFQQIAIFASDIDVAGVRTDRQSRDHRSLDHGVRVVLENQAVFAGAGLTLISIAKHVFGFRRLLGNE